MLVILFYTRVCPSIRQEQSNPPWPYTSAAAAPCNIIEWLHSLWNSLTRLTKCSGRLPMRNSTRSYFCLFFFLLLLLLLLLLFGISARNIGKTNKLCNHQMTSYFFISFILSWMFVRSLFILTGRYITRCCFRVIIPADYGEKKYTPVLWPY